MKKIILVLILLVLITKFANAQADGSLDTSFNSVDIGYGYGGAAGGNALALQPNGKILAFGGTASRLNTNGDFDSTFLKSTIYADCLVLTPFGHIIAGGNFNLIQSYSRNNIVRLKSNGVIDTLFNPGTGFDSYVRALAVQPNGKILAGGWFHTFNGDSVTGIIRLNGNGTRDTTFHCGFGASGYVNAMLLQPDGKIVIAGSHFVKYDGIVVGNLIRLFSDGRMDTTFNHGVGIGTGAAQNLAALALQPDGKIIAGGYFWSYNGVWVTRSIMRFDTDGTRDSTFGNIGFNGGSTNQTVLTLALQQDGKILVGGGFTLCDSVMSNCIARLDTNGLVDTTFNSGSGFNSAVENILVQANGQILVTGSFTYYNNFGRNLIICLNTDGSPDTSFFRNTGFNGDPHSTTIQQDGKILVLGEFTSYNNTPYFSVARLTSDGNADTSFHQHNISIRMMQGDILLQPDNKILVSGLASVVRLHTDGSRDTSFSVPNMSISSNSPIALQSDGKILAGMSNKWLIRLYPDGSIDSAFFNNEGKGFDYTVDDILLQPDGRIITIGRYNTFDSTISCRGIARINSDGTFDSTFNTGTGFDIWGADVLALQTDGKILAGGRFNYFNGSACNGLVRLNADGSRDTTFNVPTNFWGYVTGIIIQPDNKIIVGTVYNGIKRFYPNGSLDPTFNPGIGPNTSIAPSSLLSNGQLIIIGRFTSYNGIGRNHIARLFAYTPVQAEEQPTDDNFISIFPNPASASTTISLHNKVNSPIRIVVMDIQGKIIYRSKFHSSEFRISTSEFPSGIYMVELTGDKKRWIKKLIVK